MLLRFTAIATICLALTACGEARLRNLTQHHCLVVTNPFFLRSFDYRCPKGVALFIDAQLPTKRALKQCVGRVNRYHDETAPRRIATRFAGPKALP